VLLEPKEQITSVRVLVRCYPSAFVTTGERHVLTSARDLKTGRTGGPGRRERMWTLYYDRVYDEGYTALGQTGVGPCATLWAPSQTEKAVCPVAPTAPKPDSI